ETESEAVDGQDAHKRGLIYSGLRTKARINDTWVEAIIDTGSFTVALPLAGWQQLGLPWNPSRLKIKMAKGRHVRPGPQASVDITLAGVTKRVDAVVLDKKGFVLIGNNYLADDFVLDLHRHRIWSPKKPTEEVPATMTVGVPAEICQVEAEAENTFDAM